MTTTSSPETRAASPASHIRSPRLALRGLVLAALAVLLAACASAPVFRSDVVRFHDWSGATPLTFAFRPTPAQSGGLEHRSYEQLVRERLIALGFAEAAPGTARYRVEFAYGVVPEGRRVTEFWPPIGSWPYGFGYAPWYGPRPYWRTFDPWWGVPPVPITRDLTSMRHELRVDLYDVRLEPEPGRKVFESRATAFGEGEALPRLMPGLVAAVFAEFPGESGSTRRTEAPLPATGAR